MKFIAMPTPLLAVARRPLPSVALRAPTGGGGARGEYERCSETDRLPVVVSTQRERNLPLYARFGFVDRGDWQMGRRRSDPGFHTWFMLREARSDR